MVKNIILTFTITTVLHFTPAHADPNNSRLIFPNLDITSSDLSSTENKYPLYQMVDGNTKTTWVFNKDSYSSKSINTDMWLKISSKSEKIKSLSLINGYAKTPELYRKNNRIQKILVVTEYCKKQYTLTNSLEFQSIELEKPSSHIKIIFKEIQKGSHYNDTCISELMIFSDTGKNIIAEDDHMIYSTSGEYPSYSVINSKGQLVYKSPSQGISESGFSSIDKDIVYFIFSEMDGPGFGIYNINKKSYKRYFDKFVMDIKFLDRNRVKIKWIDFYSKPEPNRKGTVVITLE